MGVLLAVSLLTGCLSPTGEEFARSIFPELQFDEVLAFKPRSEPSYGCTYVVLKLPAMPKERPPKVSFPDKGFYDDLVKAGLWKETPDANSTALGDRHQCLVGRADKFDGVGIAGFSDQLREVLNERGAWFAHYGGVEGQELLIYAPKNRLAVWMRFGD